MYGVYMDIYDYTTSGGKNLIAEYTEQLPAHERVGVLAVRQLIGEKGIDLKLLEKLS